MKINRKGFTLIELLVVIAIIGIISTIVLTSVSQSQAKGYDSKIVQQLNQFRTAAQIYYLNNSSYSPDAPTTDNCNEGIFNNFDTQNGAPGATIAAGVLPEFSDPICSATPKAYAVKAPMYKEGDYWCVDSTGASLKTNNGAAATICQ